MPSLPLALRRILLAAPLFVAAPLTATAHGDDAPKVVTSIKPIHGIASAIMKDVGEPLLLIDGASSPHTYSLRPSEARALSEADLVVYVSHNLEGFLQKPLSSLSGDKHQLELVTVGGLKVLDMREGGAWEAHSHDHGAHEHAEDHDHDHEHAEEHDHDHEHDHAKDHDHDHEHDHAKDHDHDHEHAEDHDHDHEHAEDHDHEEHADHDHDHHHHEGVDGHIWMDPANGAAIARAIAGELTEIDPEHAESYQENLQALLASLTDLGNDLRAKVAPIHDKPYIVFHDAYQYLETGLGLNAVGSITVSPDQKPGAKRLHEIEDKIHDTGAVCIFAEPQFRPAIVEAVVSDTGIRAGTLDPLGSDIAAGPSAYQEILVQNVDSLVDCLGNGS